MSHKYYLSTIPGAGIVDNTYVRIPESRVGKLTLDHDGDTYLIIDFNSHEKPEIVIKLSQEAMYPRIFEYAQCMVLWKDEIHPSVDTSLYNMGEICFFEIYLKCKTVDQALLYKLSL